MEIVRNCHDSIPHYVQQVGLAGAFSQDKPWVVELLRK